MCSLSCRLPDGRFKNRQKLLTMSATSQSNVWKRLGIKWLVRANSAFSAHKASQNLNADGIKISATLGHGIDQLKNHIKAIAGYENDGESLFTARRRHLSALEQARDAVARGLIQLREHNAGELLADELLQAQNALNEITGAFTADDLLGEIFSGFCIGK